MRRIMASLAALLLTLLVTAGCAGNPADSGGVETKTIEITISGDSVTPNGARIFIDHGQPVTLVVHADKPGEIHVHSSPEQEFHYDSGTTTLPLTPIDRPGIVEVESHTLDKTIVQLEVR